MSEERFFPLELRRAAHEDAEQMCMVHYASVQDLCSDHYTPEQLDAWVAALCPEHVAEALCTPGVMGYVVKNYGMVLGFSIMNGNIVRALYVRPDAVRIGIGTTLLQVLESEAALQLHRKLHVYASLNARTFYESFGFMVLRETTYPLSKKEVLECYEMTKDIAG